MTVVIWMAYITDRLVSIRARSNMTIDIGLHVMDVRAGRRASVYVITKFNFLRSGASLLKPLRFRHLNKLV